MWFLDIYCSIVTCKYNTKIFFPKLTKLPWFVYFSYLLLDRSSVLGNAGMERPYTFMQSILSTQIQTFLYLIVYQYIFRYIYSGDDNVVDDNVGTIRPFAAPISGAGVKRSASTIDGYHEHVLKGGIKFHC